MNSKLNAEVLDIIRNGAYGRYLYRCLAPMPFRKYRKRREYLEAAIPRGFHKRLLIFNGEIVGQIEYAPPEASGYSIMGDNIIVMNCIWVLRKVKGHNLGMRLLNAMMEKEGAAAGFATIALENHWSPWMKREQMEKLGFKPLDSIKVMHKTKHKGQPFKIYLMWLPATKNPETPTWNKLKLLEGVNFCMAHPLYHPEKPRLKEILETCEE